MLYPISVPIAQSEKNLFGYINGQGQVVVDPAFAGAAAFSEGKACVLDQHGNAGFIDRSGLLVIPHRFQGLGRFVQGLCSTGGGYIDHQGAWFISPRFLLCSDFSEGRAFAAQDGASLGFIGFDGDFIVEPTFARCGPYSEGLAAVLKNERWGYVDHQGSLVVPAVFEGSRVVECQFDELRTFDKGMAPARIGGKAGFIAPDGSWIIQPLFDKSFGFFGDLAVVRTGHTWSYISRAGKIVWTSDEGALVAYPPAPLFY